MCNTLYNDIAWYNDITFQHVISVKDVIFVKTRGARNGVLLLWVNMKINFAYFPWFFYFWKWRTLWWSERCLKECANSRAVSVTSLMCVVQYRTVATPSYNVTQFRSFCSHRCCLLWSSLFTGQRVCAANIYVLHLVKLFCARRLQALN